MPRFDFECQTCGLIFEAQVAVQATEAQVTCPRGHRPVRKIFSPPAILFKGSGWYVTDNRTPDSHRATAD